jgi:SOS-response transcriptional repressor LexA
VDSCVSPLRVKHYQKDNILSTFLVVYLLGNWAENLRMNVREARYANTRTLIERCGGVTVFADKIGKSQSQASQIAGENPIKGIGNKIAAEIEAAFGLERGWLDRVHSTALSNVEPSPTLRGRVPLISWVQAGDYTRETPDTELDSPFNGSDMSYLLRVDGVSMYHPDGSGYSHGEIIHVDPSRLAEHGKDVIVRTPDGRTIFKRYIETQEGAYLESVNPAWPERIIRAPDGTVICGVVIGSWRER